jgi:hypothetical protein
MSAPDNNPAKRQHGLARFQGVSGLDDKSRRALSDLFGTSKLSEIAADALKAQWPKPPPSALSAIRSFGVQSQKARKALDRSQPPPPQRIAWPGEVEAKRRAATIRREEAMLAELGAMRNAVEEAERRELAMLRLTKWSVRFAGAAVIVAIVAIFT